MIRVLGEEIFREGKPNSLSNFSTDVTESESDSEEDAGNGELVAVNISNLSCNLFFAPRVNLANAPLTSSMEGVSDISLIME